MSKESDWKEELDFLRNLIQQTELQKTKKWGGEVYTINGGNVLSISAFKNYVSLWFFNGVFLKDPYKVLGNAQESKTKALRHWQFTSTSEMDEQKINEYIQEAIANEKKGLKWKPEKSGKLLIPTALNDAFNADEKLKTAFSELTPFKQKEYAEYIGTAKRAQTQLDRIKKITPLILEGQGLNDRYR
ncbi:hypothetical protein GCM10011506_22790 [Marivirga lumbricoides]|uniref:YdhG-like domain-containing protein n=1 Tax=Marivirga lumbricoides TaxID=1046115 RepID=A0ABQ1M8W3_9BACT|nr:hypothetical protein GCM10011506_22790 [Marivirga lumbricoides]